MITNCSPSGSCGIDCPDDLFKFWVIQIMSRKWHKIDMVTVEDYYRVGQKNTKLMAIILSNLNRFLKFFAGRFCHKLAVKWLLSIPAHLACVATLRCESN